MLLTIMNTGPARIAKLVTAWLEAGASQVSFWADDQPIAHWPREAVVDQTAELRVPLCVAGECVGEMHVAGLTGTVWFKRLETDASLFEHIYQLEHELDQMTEEMVGQQEQLVGLYQLTQSSRNHLSVDQIVRSLADATASLIGAETAFITCRETRTGGLINYYPEPPASPAVHEALQELTAAHTELLINGEEAANLPPGIDSLYYTPMQGLDTMSFGIGVLNKWDGPLLSPDIKLIRALVEHAGAQIENVRLHQEMVAKTKMQTEMDLARRVQLRLLPARPPAITGLSIYASSQPALQVGGDFFDFIPVAAGRLHFAVGDVAGKGMPAAMLMAMSRTVIRNLVRRDGDLQPAGLFGQANQDLYDDFTDVEMFATVFCGLFEPETRQLVYVNAGQSPVIYRPVEGPARYLDTDGPALGVLPFSMVSDNELRFAPGDLLVVATDGFSEARDENGELFGYERLLTLIDQLAEADAPAVADGLFDAIRVYSGTQEQDDDQTLVILKGIA
ncbi:MAG: PP2C family protein-serine/threonine phosphatase [Anaerolineales bacterium]|nr:PP2C family protein-serine/threonine phosphatase [Anaerolineales bacterium]